MKNILYSILFSFISFSALAHHDARVPTSTESPSGHIMMFRDDNGKLVWAPIAADDFCERNKADCKSNKVIKKFKLTSESYQMIWEINDAVNKSVAFTTDQVQYDKLEYWTYPTDGKGDCEDYVLEKRRRLIEAGVHPSSLSLAWVKWMWQDHAVLMVRTDHGDFILDDASPDVVGWNWKTYVYYARQYDGDPKLWVTMDDVDPNPLGRWFIFLIL